MHVCEESIARGHKHFTDDFFGDVCKQFPTDSLPCESFTLPDVHEEDAGPAARKGKTTPDPFATPEKSREKDDGGAAGRKLVDLGSLMTQKVVSLSQALDKAQLELSQELKGAQKELENPEVSAAERERERERDRERERETERQRDRGKRESERGRERESEREREREKERERD